MMKIRLYGIKSLVIDDVAFVYRPEEKKTYVCKVKPIVHEVEEEFGRTEKAIRIEPEYCVVIDLEKRAVEELTDRDTMKWITQLALSYVRDTIRPARRQLEEVIDEFFSDLKEVLESEISKGKKELSEKTRKLLEKYMYYFKIE